MQESIRNVLKSKVNSIQKDAIEFYSGEIEKGEYQKIPKDVFKLLSDNLKIKYMEIITENDVYLEYKDFFKILDGKLKLKHIFNILERGYLLHEEEFNYLPEELKIKYINDKINNSFFLQTYEFNFAPDNLKIKYLNMKNNKNYYVTSIEQDWYKKNKNISESLVTEISNLDNVYSYTKNETFANNDEDELTSVIYKFKTQHNFNFTVDFYCQGYGILANNWERHFMTIEKQYDEIDTDDRLKILNTIAKITIDFINEYKPKKIGIYHARSRKEIELNTPDIENKRTRVNKYFLEKHLPKNYKLTTFGNETEIKLNESLITEIGSIDTIYDYSKINTTNKETITYRFVGEDNIFFVKFKLMSIDKMGESFEREYYVAGEKYMSELNSPNPYKILSTVTKITVDFINEYKPGEVFISHINTNKESMNKFSIQSFLNVNKINYDEPNKRARVNRIYLTKNLPNDYKIESSGSVTYIRKK